MSKWREYRISELGTVNRGKSKHRPRNDKILYGGEYPFIQTGDVKEANFHINKHTETYNDLGLAQSKLWNAGTLCITIAANIGDTGILTYPACFPDSIVGFQPYEGVSDVRFVKYYFDIYKKHMESISMGATQNNLSIKKLESIKFLFPDLKTQEKIADILSNYDRLIENNNRRIEILEKIAEEIYKEWFVRMRFPGYENTKFIKGIPEGWEVITLGQIVTFINGYAFSSVDYLEEGQYKIITIKNVKDGNIDTLNTVFLNGFPKNMNDNIKLNIGDMLLSLTGNVGRVGLVTEENLLLNQRVAKIEPINKKYSGFIYFLFRSDNNKSKLIDISTGAAQQNLSPAKALKIKFIGNYNKIIEFSSRVEPIIKCIIKIKIQNQNLIKQRDLLLPRLMNGTIQVK